MNLSAAVVNLKGWILADLDQDRHVIASDLLIQPGAYLVFAKNGDVATNGGVLADYVYTGLSLANGTDELLLLAPDNREVDRVVWGDEVGLAMPDGASLERTTLVQPGTWASANTIWSGSAGDQGSPGAAYESSPPSPTSAPSVSASPSPPLTTVVPTLLPTAVSPTPTRPTTWMPSTVPGLLQIEEIAFRGSDLEFVALVNVSSETISGAGYVIGDAQQPGNGEGMYELPQAMNLNPGAIFVIARNGLAFRQYWGRPAHAEFEETDPDISVLNRRRDLATGKWALKDGGDEVLLLNPDGALADAVAYGEGNYTELGLRGELQPPSDFSLHRVPGSFFPLERDVRHRFLAAPAAPFSTITLPEPVSNAKPRLDEGTTAFWGALGAYSNFTSGHTAPPHFLAYTAAAQGLDFLAAADPPTAENWSTASGEVPPLLWLPAWTWSHTEAGSTERAIVYGQAGGSIVNRSSLLDFLHQCSAIAQWQSGNPPNAAGLIATNADSVYAPSSLLQLFQDWYFAQKPLLPAGNGHPELTGYINLAPRFTGLAVAEESIAGVRRALAAHRGWVTSSPHIWLTLRGQVQSETLSASTNNGPFWMGEQIGPSNALQLFIQYGDLSGEPAGLAIWQDDHPIRQLDLPPTDGRWSVEVPAVPGSFLYAVATQLDGDFAVTAPIHVLPGGTGRVIINEVVPRPSGDYNGDGVINTDDELIELYNPGNQPVSLAQYQLGDAQGETAPSRRFTFGPGRFIGGGELLLLWRSETRVSLNDDADEVILRDPTGMIVDKIGWSQRMAGGVSLSRLPDGQEWRADALVTPGRSNRVDEIASDAPRNPTQGTGTKTDDSDSHDVEPEPGIGQASGPPGSLAEAKRRGLEQWVEFQAVVVVPPGLFNASIYVAEPAPLSTYPLAGLGIQVYLFGGAFPSLQEGDRVLIRGVLDSFRGEMETILRSPEQIWRMGPGIPLTPLPIQAIEVGESHEGRLVTFRGLVDGWSRDSIYFLDPENPDSQSVRVTVRSSLKWQRPYVNRGEEWRITGIVSQFAKEAPWNGGYRVLVRYESDLERISD